MHKGEHVVIDDSDEVEIRRFAQADGQMTGFVILPNNALAVFAQGRGLSLHMPPALMRELAVQLVAAAAVKEAEQATTARKAAADLARIVAQGNA
jgi:hypothetical protein